LIISKEQHSSWNHITYCHAGYFNKKGNVFFNLFTTFVVTQRFQYFMKALFPVLCAALLTLHAQAQQVTVDQSFNSVDKGSGKFSGEDSYYNDDIEQSIIQPDGKMLVSGLYSFINDTARNCIARLNPDGTLDKSFQVYGFESNFGSGLSFIRLQKDGKIIVCTKYPEFSYNKNIHIIRLNADGTRDNTFKQAPMQYIPFYVADVAVQSDGKLVVAGDGNQYGYGRSVVRLNINGSYDKTFRPDSIHSYTVLTLAITSKGQILGGGYFNLSDDSPVYTSLKMFNADGSYDKSFSTNIPVDYNITKLAIQPDSKILFATNYIDGPNPSLFGRLNSNGSRDTSFIVRNGPDRTVNAITVLPNGKILIGGDFSKYKNVYAKGIARLNANGTLDKTFISGAGISYNSNIGFPNIQTISVDKDGHYFIGGYFNVYNHIGAGGMMLLNSNGTINHSFNHASTTGAEDAVFAIAIQKDKKVLIAGDFVQYNGVNRDKIARLNADGTLDNSFNIGNVQGDAADSNAYIHKLLIQQNGKILVGGNFSYINGHPHTLLARLNSNGSLDESFKAQITRLYDYNYSRISAIVQQPDGKILVGVSRQYLFESWDYEPILYRLNVDGSIDPSFMVYDAFQSYNDITCIAVQADGKILVGGTLPVSSGELTYNNIVRLNKNGTVDNTFSKSGMASLGTDEEVKDIHIMPNGKIILAGHFRYYNGSVVTPVIRLDAKGLLDKTFRAPASLFKSKAFELTPIAADSSNVYIGFCSLTGTTLWTRHTVLYKLKANGALDSTYNTGDGANSIIYAMALDANNQLLIGGSFTSFNGVGKNHIARLTVCKPTKQATVSSNLTSLQSQAAAAIVVTPNPTSDNVWLQTISAKAERTTVKIINAQGEPLAAISTTIPAGINKQLLSLSRYAAGVYFIVVENSSMRQTLKVVKE
jgi:uncharacterized delta-60 repeat protein